MAARQGVNTTARTDLALSKSFWKRVAEQLRERRRRAEMEKARLSAIVNAQGTYLESLGLMLRECPSWLLSAAVTAAYNEAHDTLSDRRCLRLKSSDGALYEVFILDSHSSNVRVNQVFKECGMDSLPIGTVSAHRRHHPNGEVRFIQYVNKLLQPFSFEDTCSSTWKLSALPHRKHDRQVFHYVIDPDHTVAVKFRLKKTLSCGSTVSILKRVVSRRFTSDNSVLIVWKIFWEGEGICSGMDIDETSWARFRPYSDEVRTGALMEVCTRLVSVHGIATDAEDDAVKAFQLMLQESLEEDEREVISSLGKLLRKSF